MIIMESFRSLHDKIADENNYIKNNIVAFGSLTQREKMVIALLMHGFDMYTIAEQMGITESSVQNYQRSISEKLSINNTKALFKFARTFEII